jgi:hypothetical protein
LRLQDGVWGPPVSSNVRPLLAAVRHVGAIDRRSTADVESSIELRCSSLGCSLYHHASKSQESSQEAKVPEKPLESLRACSEGRPLATVIGRASKHHDVDGDMKSVHASALDIIRRRAMVIVSMHNG